MPARRKIPSRRRSRTSSRRRSPSSSCSWTAGRARSIRSTRSRARKVQRQAVPHEGRSRRSSTTSATTLASPWKFKKYGQSGLPVSELFPHVGARADDLAVIRSMVSNFSEHTNANYFLHTGNGQQGRPSIGAWVTYGLGSECRDLPGLRRAGQRHDPARRDRLFRQRLSAGRVSGVALQQRRTPGRGPHAARRRERDDSQRQTRSPSQARCASRRTATAIPTPSTPPSPTTNSRSACRRPCRNSTDLSRETQETHSSTASTTRRRRCSAGSASSLGVWSNAASASSSCCARTSATTAGTSTANLKKGHEDNARAVDKPIAGLLDGPETPRPAGGDARDLGRRIRPHAGRAGHRRPRPQSVRLHDVAGRRRNEGRHHRTARPTTSAITP